MTDEIESFVISGQITKNRNLLNEAIKRREGKEILITIETVSRQRTSQQNRYIHRLFTIFTQALNELGNDFTMAQVKGICAAKFLVVEEVEKSTGEVIGERIRSTTELNTVEFNEYFEKIIAWAATVFGIVLPLPNEDIIP